MAAVLSFHVHEGTDVHFGPFMYMHGAAYGYLYVPACTSMDKVHVREGTVMD